MQRKKYSDEFKQQIIKEAIETGNCSIVARKHNLIPSNVARWVRTHSNGNNSASKNYYPDKNSKELAKENEQLKKILGEKELEIAILRDRLKKTNQR